MSQFALAEEEKPCSHEPHIVQGKKIYELVKGEPPGDAGAAKGLEIALAPK